MSRVNWHEAFNLLFSAFQGRTFQLESLAAAQDEWKDFFKVTHVSASANTSFVFVIKPLTPSSRNPQAELNYQIIENARDNLQKAAKKHKATALYMGWNRESNAFLIPSPSKVADSANQGSIYWPKPWLTKHANEIEGKVAIKQINDAADDCSHLVLVDFFPHYISALANGSFNLETFKPKSVPPQIDDIGVMDLPALGQTSGSDQSNAPAQLPKRTKRKANDGAQPTSITFCGPPGTGKTRAAVVLADLLLSSSEIPNDLSTLQSLPYPENLNEETNGNLFRTQFHPSYSYEDFLEGLRPVERQQDGEGSVTYKVIPGVLKIAANLARARSQPGQFGISFVVQYLGDSKWKFSEALEVQLYQLAGRNGEIRYQNKRVHLTGDAGNSQYSVPLEDQPQTPGQYTVTWYSDGSGNDQFVLIIDEFNRGNPARIFGEALSLIEETKRLDAEEEASLVLPYSHERLTLPQNLHLICAMNLADKSLAAIDQALRRRFRFVYLRPQFHLVEFKNYNYRGSLVRDAAKFQTVHDGIIEHFDAVNNALKDAGISEDRQIGHSYAFKLLANFYRAMERSRDSSSEILARECLAKLWNDEIHPLIRDILGEHRIGKFRDALAQRLSSTTNAVSKISSSEELKSFLDSSFPSEASSPWKAA
jgi:MoxR-like ATPase